MRLACVVVVVLFASNVAHAEDRSAVVSVSGGVGAEWGASDDAVPLEGALYREPNGGGTELAGVRATLAWERPSPDFVADGKSNFSGSLVPELVVGSLVDDQRAQGYLGLGLRAELRAAHNRIMPFGLRYKVGGYFVGRALVVGKEQDAAYEFGFGEYFPRFSTFTRVGFEMTVAVRPHYMDTDETQYFGLFSIFAGWAP